MADADDITLDVQELIDRKEIVAASIKIIGLNAPSNIVRALMEPNRQLDFGMNDPTGYFSGIVAYEQGNYDLAKKNLKPFAEKGHSKAQFMMAIIGYEETGVAKDQAEAVRWYRKLAENGDEFAQTRLVKAYEKGNGVNQDQAEAVRWYRKLAEKGVVRAQFKLGLIYYNGSDPIKASHAEAFHWFSEAAKKNNGKAQHWVANMLHLGEGVPPNTELALQWIDKAIKNGAGKDAEELKEHMGWCKDHESESRFKKKKKKEVKKPEGE